MSAAKFLHSYGKEEHIMSRIGKKPVSVPAGVEVKLDGTTLTVKGPKGTLTETFNKDMIIKVEGNEIIVERPSEDKLHKSLHGLTRTLIHNMIIGVTEGYSKTLEIEGIGYRAAKQGTNLVMNLGFSHQVIVGETDEIKLDVLTQIMLLVRVSTSRRLVSSLLNFVRRDLLSHIRARVSVMPVNISSVRKVKPVRVRSNLTFVFNKILLLCRGMGQPERRLLFFS